MNKFLSIPVTGEGSQLVPMTDVKVINVGSKSGATAATVTTLFYSSGKAIEITHASVGAASATNSGTQFRSFLQTNLIDSLGTGWTEVVRIASPKFDVSNIVISTY